MYTLVLKQNVRKKLDKLDESLQRRIGLAFEKLMTDPFQGKKLEGKYKGLRSLRVWPYRIIYEIRNRELIVTIIAVAHRKDAYR